MNWLARPPLTLGIAFLGLALSVACTRRSNEKSDPKAQGRSVRENVWSGKAPSCSALPATCGPSGNEDCCKSPLVPGGTYARSYDAVDYRDSKSVATVSDFTLDKYEVTVGRFRAFVNAGGGTQAHPPEEGAGAHPKIRGSGWSSAWNAKLPADTASLKLALKCFVHQSWTDAAGSNENKPINCLDWYTAFAFCAWDGGRLPTEAEWNYAASGGAEQRYYPWSNPATSTAIDDSYAVYCGRTCSLQNVGSRSPKGDGKWGHSDLGGNAWEWMLDWDPVQYAVPCHDCALVKAGSYRAFRSGSNDDIAPTLRSATRHVNYPEIRTNIGARCARTP